MYCWRCHTLGTFSRNVYSPASAPPRRGPVRAGAVGAGTFGPKIGEWGFLGRLGKPFKMAVPGPPGGGKTSAVLQLCERMQETWGPVLFMALDEGPESASFREKLARFEIRRTFIDYGSWAEIAATVAGGGWAVVAIDSINRCPVPSFELDSYTRSMGVSWILTQEVTKAGEPRGSNTWAHWADTVVTVADGVACTGKNRYGISGAKKRIFGEEVPSE